MRASLGAKLGECHAANITQLTSHSEHDRELRRQNLPANVTQLGRLQSTQRAIPPRRDGLLFQIKAVVVHHLHPRGDKVADEFFAAIVLGVHFGDGAQLRVGAKH